MADARKLSDELIAAYNRQDFDRMEAMIAPDIDFAHFNRNFEMHSRDELVATLRTFAAQYFTARHFEEPEKVVIEGNTAVRVAWYVGTAKVDLPGFGNAGETFRFKFCSVMRFDDAGMLVEWKDFG